jgi:hypothetical protein
MTTTEHAVFLAGLCGKAVAGIVALGSESRNRVERVSFVDGTTAILKWYEPAVDRFWDHRFRREEKVLSLLAGVEPRVAPAPLAGFIASGGPAALLMEDAGRTSLADALSTGAVSWAGAAEFACRLRAAMDAVAQPLRRTAMSIVLDRLTAGSLISRLNVASRRMTGRGVPVAVEREYTGFVRPLLAAPRGPVHNSLSPLNVVAGDAGLRAIDWETVAWASPAWDWAELLRAPYAALPLDEAVATAGARGIEAEVFCRAALCRHLDSLATVRLRRDAFVADGRADRSAEYARRAAFYAADIRALAQRLGAPAALQKWLMEVTSWAI